MQTPADRKYFGRTSDVAQFYAVTSSLSISSAYRYTCVCVCACVCVCVRVCVCVCACVCVAQTQFGILSALTDFVTRNVQRKNFRLRFGPVIAVGHLKSAYVLCFFVPFFLSFLFYLFPFSLFISFIFSSFVLSFSFLSFSSRRITLSSFSMETHGVPLILAAVTRYLHRCGISRRRSCRAQEPCKGDALIANLTVSSNYKPVYKSYNESLNVSLICAMCYPFWAEIDATVATLLVMWSGRDGW